MIGSARNGRFIHVSVLKATSVIQASPDLSGIWAPLCSYDRSDSTSKAMQLRSLGQNCIDLTFACNVSIYPRLITQTRLGSSELNKELI
jgi:hypothetical protein